MRERRGQGPAARRVGRAGRSQRQAARHPRCADPLGQWSGRAGDGNVLGGGTRITELGVTSTPPPPGDAELPSPYEASVRGRIADPAAYANSAVTWLFSETCRDGDFELPGFDRAGDIHSAVHQWLAPVPGFASYEGMAGAEGQLRRLQAMDAAQGRAYLTRYLAGDAVPGCDPAEVPVP